MKKFLLFFCTAITLTGIANAQNRQPGSARGDAAGPAATIAAVTQNLKKFEGYFNFYYDEKSGKVYLEIDKFNTDFLYFSSLVDGVGNGGAERGQASSVITRFVKAGPKIFLVEPVTSYRAVNGNADEVKAVEHNFAKSVIFAFTPAAIEGDKVLVDFTPFTDARCTARGRWPGWRCRGNPGTAQAAGGRGGAGGGAAGAGLSLR
jgi:hypothetical protein